MTDTLSLTEIETQLAAAQADLALFQRLSGAAGRVTRLTAEHDKAKAAHDKADAEKAKAAEEARFAGLRDLRITETPGSKSSSVLSSQFHISYTRDAYDMDVHATVPQPVSRPGFTALEPNVLAWIAQRHPDKIPASIMALAPGNVDAALGSYFAGLRRGYLKA